MKSLNLESSKVSKKKSKGTPISGKKYLKKGLEPVKAKKYLGQHFLKDEEVARRLAETLTLSTYRHVIEIGPGTGMLTKYLLQQEMELIAMELDSESVIYLRHSFTLEHSGLPGSNHFQIVEANFLTFDLKTLFGSTPFAIIGNFPYNISSQIVFKLLEYRQQVPEFSGMFQKEVALRICAKEGNKVYGILSVLVQAFYTASYLFTVPPEVFEPVPKVESGVLQLKRRDDFRLECDEILFFRLVKTAFNHRRKTLRNSLRPLDLSEFLRERPIFNKRPEQLSVSEFIQLTLDIEQDLS